MLNPAIFTGQLFLPIQNDNSFTGPILILNYNQSHPSSIHQSNYLQTYSNDYPNLASVSSSVIPTTTVYEPVLSTTSIPFPDQQQSFQIMNFNDNQTPIPLNNLLETLNSTTDHCVDQVNQEDEPYSSTQLVEYPLSLHEECDKLYLNYIESCQSKVNEEDSLVKELSTNEHGSSKWIDTPSFGEHLNCEELTFLNDNRTEIQFGVSVCPTLSFVYEEGTEIQLGSSGNQHECPSSMSAICPCMSNNPSDVVATNIEEETICQHVAITTCEVSTCCSTQSSQPSSHVKSKRQRPLSMQCLNSNKKVKTQQTFNMFTNNNSQTHITWHHVSIDSNMNQQENTFIYENSYNILESFQSSKPSSSSATLSNNNELTNPQEYSSIIIETPESISKKMKRGRPKKVLQIE